MVRFFYFGMQPKVDSLLYDQILILKKLDLWPWMYGNSFWGINAKSFYLLLYYIAL